MNWILMKQSLDIFFENIRGKELYIYTEGNVLLKASSLSCYEKDYENNNLIVSFHDIPKIEVTDDMFKMEARGTYQIPRDNYFSFRTDGKSYFLICGFCRYVLFDTDYKFSIVEHNNSIDYVKYLCEQRS